MTLSVILNMSPVSLSVVLNLSPVTLSVVLNLSLVTLSVVHNLAPVTLSPRLRAQTFQLLSLIWRKNELRYVDWKWIEMESSWLIGVWNTWISLIINCRGGLPQIYTVWHKKIYICSFLPNTFLHLFLSPFPISKNNKATSQLNSLPVGIFAVNCFKLVQWLSKLTNFVIEIKL